MRTSFVAVPDVTAATPTCHLSPNPCAPRTVFVIQQASSIDASNVGCLPNCRIAALSAIGDQSGRRASTILASESREFVSAAQYRKWLIRRGQRRSGSQPERCVVIVDDATHEAVAIIPEHTIDGDHLTRILDGICSQRGTPAVIRTDNGQDFTGKLMLTRAHRQNIRLRLIEPGKPNQNAYVASCNGRFRVECRNVHWFVLLAHARPSASIGN